MNTRSPSTSDLGKGAVPKETLKSVISKRKREMLDHPEPGPSVDDPYAGATASATIVRGPTGIIYDPTMLNHCCEWDEDHPERPERLKSIIERCSECGLLEQCVEVPNPERSDLYTRIIQKHSPEHYEKLKALVASENLTIMEEEASKFDSIYFNKSTFEAATLAVTSVLNLTLAVAQGTVMNGMAFVRPPGHHAMHEEFNGYCFFNNVAIAAQAALDEGLASRVLIVDIDVHHGQGTQRMFYDSKDVLYFSIHRYEHGYFWPNLPESNFSYIGKGEGLGYNVNVPLNATGLTDDDYLAIIFNLLLPMGYEFNPDLIIVSAGYDAAIGCPEGKMQVTPGFYAHLISLLHTMARGKIAVILEGGYCLPTLAEGACMTLKSLLGGPCPQLNQIRSVHPTVRVTIQNVKRIFYEKWICFASCEFQNPEISDEYDECRICYFGEPEKPPFPTRNCYPSNTTRDLGYYTKLNEALREKYQEPMGLPVLYVYDESMLLHTPQAGDVERPERPERLSSIIRLFDEFGLDKRLQRIPITPRNFENYSPHAPGYFDTINVNSSQTKDVYVNEFTHEAVWTAVSGLLTLTDAVMNGEGRSGVAVIRPPGHHADFNKSLGFCFINNVAVAANYLLKKYNVSRILIVDFDIHHGNGTQNLFYTNHQVMYMSIHRDDYGRFFPTNTAKSYIFDGHGPGKGFNVNIPFNRDKMGNTEYMAVFHNLILPIAYSYAPEVVLVSAGFDAGIHDPLGGYVVSPETFGHMIMMLKGLAQGRLILSLEGGYNLTTTSNSLAICTKALLGDPIIMPRNVYRSISAEAISTIRYVIDHFKQYYDIFHVHAKLPNIPVVVRRVDNFFTELHGKELSRALDSARMSDEYVESEMQNLSSTF